MRFQGPSQSIDSNTGTDLSSTITTGGTAQQLTTVPANGFYVYNPDAALDLWVAMFGTTAVANGTGCIRVQANGGSFVTPPNFVPTGNVSIVGSVTGQKFTAGKW
jgi:hypothetical protein